MSSEIEQRMIETLREVEAERKAWSDAFESLRAEYATIRQENKALHERIEHLGEQVKQLTALVERSRKR